MFVPSLKLYFTWTIQTASTAIYVSACSTWILARRWCWKVCRLECGQNWSCLRKILDEVSNRVPLRCNFDGVLYREHSSGLFWAFRWWNLLFGDEYLLLGAVGCHFWCLQNRRKASGLRATVCLQSLFKLGSLVWGKIDFKVGRCILVQPVHIQACFVTGSSFT